MKKPAKYEGFKRVEIWLFPDEVEELKRGGRTINAEVRHRLKFAAMPTKGGSRENAGRPEREGGSLRPERLRKARTSRNKTGSVIATEPE